MGPSWCSEVKGTLRSIENWDTIMYTEVRRDHHSPVWHNEVQWSTVKYNEQKRFSEIQVQSCVVCVVQYVHCSLSLSIWIDPDQAMPSIGNQYHWADQTNIDSTLLRENKTVCFCAIRRLNQYLGVRRLICVQSEAFDVASIMSNIIKIFFQTHPFRKVGLWAMPFQISSGDAAALNAGVQICQHFNQMEIWSLK